MTKFRSLLRRILAPLRTGLRTPEVQQIHASECGSACLGIVLAYFGCWLSMDELRRACSVSRDGCTAMDIKRAAAQYGVKVTGWRREPNRLSRLKLPAILFWEFNHFVVLERVGESSYSINDPSNGRRSVPAEQFKKSFTGVVLELELQDAFQTRGEPPRIRKRLAHWFRGHRGLLWTCAICSLVLVVPGIGLPLFLRSFIDDALGLGEPIGFAIVGGVFALAALMALATWAQQRSLRLLSIKVSVEQAENFLTTVFRLPIEYFASRFAGDLASRTQLIDIVANGGVVQLTKILLDLATCSVFLIAMFILAPNMTFLVVAVACIGLLALSGVTRLRSDENHRVRREQSQLAGISNYAVRNLSTLRATGIENDFFVSWSGFQARELTSRQQFGELSVITNSIPVLMALLGSVIVVSLGSLHVISGTMTIGDLMAFYFLAANFLVPIGGFIRSLDLIQVLNADIRRIDDVADVKQEPSLVTEQHINEKPVATIDGRLRLAGYLSMRGVSFGYKQHSQPLIDNFDISISPGQRIAIVGASGSGKSTIALLLAGVYRPWTGEVLFDDHLREDIPRSILTSSVAFVDQQITLFSGTIRENLTMWDSSIPDALIIDAARDAAIHDEIARRPLNYSSRVEEGGTNFSVGQRQRLEIARALVNRPSLIVLDEATSSLDAVVEAQIDDALRRRGCACVIIAHRLSTIRDCDEIIVLDKGRTAQRGTHDELIAEQDGSYRVLVSTQ